jgi:crossover junction endodeoxyribonuclease RusA
MIWPDAPIPAAIHFDVSGLPAPQGSKKAFVNPRTNRAVVVDVNPKPLRSWRQDIIEAAKAARGDSAPLDCAVGLGVVFRLPRPQSHYGAHGIKPNAPRYVSGQPDLDKLLRALLDAVTIAGVWRDDGRVASIIAHKVYSDLPGCEVWIREMRLTDHPAQMGLL